MTKIDPRPYQRDALNSVYAELKASENVLLQAMCGAGKTFMACVLIQKLSGEMPGNFLVLAHKQELVEQFQCAFKQFTNIPEEVIGICCSGIGKPDVSKRITVGTVQTFVNHLAKYQGAVFVCIDEVHRVAIGNNSQYEKVLKHLKELQPDYRVLGITATVGRLGHGKIYGDECRPGNHNLFKKVAHHVKYSTLRDSGYLAPLKGKVVTSDQLEADLSKVPKRYGEFVVSDLGDVMSKEIHVQSIVDGLHAFCSEYRCVCVFACTISHAEKVAEAIGEEATIVHSKLTKVERYTNMSLWKTGRKRVMVGVNILIEGFDLPMLDCLIMARATASSSLYIQAIGRVLRMFKGKKHGFLLDITDNTMRFGLDLDNVRIDVPKKGRGEGEAIEKICPGEYQDGSVCAELLHASVRVCPHCGHKFTRESVEALLPELKAVEFNIPDPPETIQVGLMDCSHAESRKTGKEMLRVDFMTTNTFNVKAVSLYMMFPNEYGHDSLPVKKTRKEWVKLTDEPFPESATEAYFLCGTFRQPSEVTFIKNGRFKNITHLSFDKSIGDFKTHNTA